MRDNLHSIFFGLTIWSPNINIFRDPRWGRGQETYGEDPFLTGRMGVAFVRACRATIRNTSAPSPRPSITRFTADPNPCATNSMSTSRPHDLEDTFLPAFRATIIEGHAGSIMCAYNSIDGVPACANTMLLQHYLRQDWDFQGFVTSDCGAIADFYLRRRPSFSPDAAHASATAVKAGTDTSCGQEYKSLVDAVHQRLISEFEIDSALRRLFTARFKLGMFDPPSEVKYAQIPFSERRLARASRSRAEDRARIHRAAEKRRRPSSETAG